jgi:hypothetical protein
MLTLAFKCQTITSQLVAEAVRANCGHRNTLGCQRGEKPITPGGTVSFGSEQVGGRPSITAPQQTDHYEGTSTGKPSFEVPDHR